MPVSAWLSPSHTPCSVCGFSVATTNRFPHRARGGVGLAGRKPVSGWAPSTPSVSSALSTACGRDTGIAPHLPSTIVAIVDGMIPAVGYLNSSLRLRLHPEMWSMVRLRRIQVPAGDQ